MRSTAAQSSNNTPPGLQPETLRDRLLTKEGKSLSADRGSLSKCALRFREFSASSLKVSKCADGEKSSELQKLRTLKDDLIRELQLHDLEMKKLELASQVADAELEYYEAIVKETASSTALIKKEIEAEKNKLYAKSKLKQNVEEYEALAKLANRYTSIRENTQTMNEVNIEMEKIRAEVKESEKELEMRGVQFQLLMQTIFDLKNSLKEDAKIPK